MKLQRVETNRRLSNNISTNAINPSNLNFLDSWNLYIVTRTLKSSYSNNLLIFHR